MPLKQTQNFKERFDDLLQEMAASAVTPEHITDLITTFVSHYKRLEQLVEMRVSENKTEMTTETERIGKQAAEFEKRLRKIVNSSSKAIDEKVKLFRIELQTEIGYVEDFIDNLEDYDDTKIFEEHDKIKTELKEIRDSIPKEFDATDLEKRLNKAQDDIEELKKRPVGGTVSGVSDMRIRQAAKYIVKTEAPVGDIDGANTDYTVSQPIFAVLSFMINGEYIGQIPNYTIAGNTISFSVALPAAYSGKDFEIVYI